MQSLFALRRRTGADRPHQETISAASERRAASDRLDVPAGLVSGLPNVAPQPQSVAPSPPSATATTPQGQSQSVAPSQRSAADAVQRMLVDTADRLGGAAAGFISGSLAGFLGGGAFGLSTLASFPVASHAEGEARLMPICSRTALVCGMAGTLLGATIGLTGPFRCTSQRSPETSSVKNAAPPPRTVAQQAAGLLARVADRAGGAIGGWMVGNLVGFYPGGILGLAALASFPAKSKAEFDERMMYFASWSALVVGIAGTGLGAAIGLTRACGGSTAV